MRLDLYLVQSGQTESRTQAKKYIEKGNVTLDGKVVTTPACEVDDTTPHIVLIIDRDKYVGRGGYKLEKALGVFDLHPTGMDCLDIGASTGGFTDCLLQHGARHVTAVDVGQSQMAERLKKDGRVTVIEGCNARYLTPDGVGTFDLIVMDVSFISATLILPVFPALLREGGQAVVLIKPQFELTKSELGKGGIVKKESLRQTAKKRVTDCSARLGFVVKDVVESPIQGGDGNVEYLAYLQKIH